LISLGTASITSRPSTENDTRTAILSPLPNGSLRKLRLINHENHIQVTMPRYPKDLTGNRYGALTVLSFISRNSHGNSRWLCLCDCGKRVPVMYQNLGKRTNSCGCGMKVDQQK